MIEQYKKITFNVAGISFENRDRKLIKALNQYAKEGYFEKYGGFTAKEIREGGFDAFEYENFSSSDVKIVETLYENKTAYEVYLKDLNNSWIMVGYIPKNDIAEYESLLAIGDFTTGYATIVGGRFKTCDYDDYGEEKIVTKDHLSIGVQVTISFLLHNPVYTCNKCHNEITEEIHKSNNGLCEECLVKTQKEEKLNKYARKMKKFFILIILSIILTFVFIPLIFVDFILIGIYGKMESEYKRMEKGDDINKKI